MLLVVACLSVNSANTRRLFIGGSWSAREGMIPANNILCSRNNKVLNFLNGANDGGRFALSHFRF